MRILIADDHAIVRRGLKQILAEELGKATFVEAQTGAEVLQRVWKEKWDLVLLDINMPGRNGIEVLPELKAASPTLPVLMLSALPLAEYAVRALRAGAAGYLAKESATEELIAAVRKVLAGGRYVTAELGEKLAGELAADARQSAHEKLSNREYQIMKMLANARTVKEIGADLALSAKTVSTYRVRLLKKLGLKSNVELARYAYQRGLVQ